MPARSARRRLRPAVPQAQQGPAYSRAADRAVLTTRLAGRAELLDRQLLVSATQRQPRGEPDVELMHPPPAAAQGLRHRQRLAQQLAECRPARSSASTPT